MSGFSVDATYIYQGVTQDNNDQWRLESDGHIGADLQAISTAYIWKLNPSGDVLMGTRYYREQQTGTIVMTAATPHDSHLHHERTGDSSWTRADIVTNRR